jgi:hypothetical protein
MSESERRPAFSSDFATSTRLCTSHWCGATPVVSLKAREKWLTDSPHCLATSRSVALP